MRLSVLWLLVPAFATGVVVGQVQNLDCGLTNKPIHVLGGFVPNEDLPWAASLGKWVTNKTSGQLVWGHVCGASLITDSFLLSAAHCFFNGPLVPANEVVARIGVMDFARLPDPSSEFPVKRVVVHPKYTFPQAYFDVALVEVPRITLTASVQRICLPLKASINPDLYLRNAVSLAGWGRDEKDAPAQTKLRVVQLEVFSQKFCDRRYKDTSSKAEADNVLAFLPNLFNPNTVCAGFFLDGFGSCQGDSGSPLFLFDSESGRLLLIGVNSGALDCGKKSKPGVFVRVDHPEVLNFISRVSGLQRQGLVDFDDRDWANGCSFNGRDVGLHKVPSDQCLSKCLEVLTCTSYVWRPQDGGTCSLKGGPVDKMDAVPDLPNTVCGVVPANSTQDVGTSCKFDGEDLGQVLIAQEQCADACRNFPRCSHWYWTEANDGTCFFRRAKLPMSSSTRTTRFSVCGIVREKIVE